MKSKFATGPSLWFLLRFTVVFGLLIAPWPRWNQAYSQYFQSFGQMVFNWGAGNRVVDFKPNTGDFAPQLDAEMTLENRALVDSNGKTRGTATAIETRSVGWVPTALTIALVAATPIPWRRRLVALASGLVLIHLFIFFSLQTWIWYHSPDVSLTTLSDFWKSAAHELNYAMLNQLGVSFSVPVVIWILVTFRRQDELA